MATKSVRGNAAKAPKIGTPLGLQGKGLVTSAHGERRLELRIWLRQPRNLFGRVVGVSERTVAKVETGAEDVKKLRRQYNEVYRLVRQLREVVDPESVGPWFETPNDAFDGAKPIELIERGEIDRLWEMVYRLRSGSPG